MVDDRRDDAELIAASLTDPAPFELVFDRHYDSIHRYLARRGGRELADDLTQSVFLAGFEGRKRFRPSEAASAAPWLFGIATRSKARVKHSGPLTSRRTPGAPLSRPKHLPGRG